LRIGIVTHAYYPHFGGVTENVAATRRQLARRGHRVIVITAGAPGAEKEPGVIRIGGQILVPWNGATVNLTHGLALETRLAEIYRRERLDLLHIHCPLAPMLPLAALRAARGRPVLGMFHATARANLGYALFRPFLAHDFAHITVPVAVSEPARRFVAQYFPGRYRIVPNGVDLERFSPSVPPGIARDGIPTILSMGRLDPRKGIEHLIDALPLVARALGRVRLLVAGDGPRGRDLRAHAAAHARGLVEFLGSVKAADVPGLYAAADCLCAPAVRNESFGIVLLEAMASARPVVASDIAGYRQVVVPGETGLLAAPGDPGALARSLIDVLADPGRRRAMGDAGRQRARQYAWDQVTEQLLALYSEALGPVPARETEGAERRAAAARGEFPALIEAGSGAGRHLAREDELVVLGGESAVPRHARAGRARAAKRPRSARRSEAS
jgi:phosphatidylinositol alpha-mannosyltransferase